jgi:uncharacterized lipoprotein YmbA
VSGFLAACGSSPDPDYYTLAPVAGAVTPLHTSIELERPSLPDILDRPEIVQQDTLYRISIDDSRHWAAPFTQLFAQTLALNLRQRMPASVIVAEDNYSATAASLRVDVLADALATNGQSALLHAQIIAADGPHCANGTATSSSFLAKASGPAPESYSAIVGRLADAVVTVVKKQAAHSRCAL